MSVTCARACVATTDPRPTRIQFTAFIVSLRHVSFQRAPPELPAISSDESRHTWRGRRARPQPDHGQDCLMNPLISFGDANTTDARSPCMPAPTATGLPGSGPRLLESVLNRRLNSQILWVLPSAVPTV